MADIDEKDNQIFILRHEVQKIQVSLLIRECSIMIHWLMLGYTAKGEICWGELEEKISDCQGDDDKPG